MKNEDRTDAHLCPFSSICVCALKRFLLFFGLDTLGEVFVQYPSFHINNRWEVVQDGRVLAQIRCISGVSLKVICAMHKKVSSASPSSTCKPPKRDDAVCKMHININGYFDGCQAALLKWAIYGTMKACDGSFHAMRAVEEQSKWRTR